MDYNYFKLLHLLAAMIFITNIISDLFHIRLAVKTRDLKIIAFTTKGIRNRGRYVTIPSVLLIIVFGVLAAKSGHFPIARTGWIFWSVIMFLISIVALIFKVTPFQKKLYHLTLNKDSFADPEWMQFSKVLFTWSILGTIVLTTSLAALTMMTLKMPQ